MDEDEDEDDEPALGFKISLREVDASQSQAQADASVGYAVEIIVRWVLGAESVLFESFCGMLKRKMAATNEG